MKLSLVIPCYNESQSLPDLVAKIEESFSGHNIEVIIVDNGSIDSTPDVIRRLSKNQSNIWRSIRVEKNVGYGFGIMKGLHAATGDILAWTHADLQTDPTDALYGFTLFEKANNPDQLFVKGLRYGRPLIDVVFTFGMSVFETILMHTPMRDINAQPTMFHRALLTHLEDAPNDFALDLFIYWKAVQMKKQVKRFPVRFGPRKFGSSHWNTGMKARYRFIKRTLSFSMQLKNSLEKNQ
jgi:glycosyltransferase involved in cell wall biosynthesis